MIDNYRLNNTKNEQLDNVKNYLAKVSNIMKQNILMFIKKIPSLEKSIYSNIEKYLDLNINTNNIHFYHTYIKNLLDVFPNIILKKNINYGAIPEHWDLSEIHKKDIEEILKRYYDKLMIFSEVPEMELVFKIIKNKCSVLQNLSYATFFNESIVISNLSSKNMLYSVFDEEYIKYFFTYVYYSIFNEIINITNDTQFNLELSGYNNDTYSSDELEVKLVNYIHDFLVIMNNHNNLLKNSYKKIKEKISFAKEKEKDLITDYLKNLTDEEREIENLFKNNKLEKWSKGLQKGLTKYIKENYDEERLELEKQAKKEFKLKQNNNVTEMNKEIYSMEFEEQEKIDQEIEDEEYNMNNIPDDDDYDDSDYDYE